MVSASKEIEPGARAMLVLAEDLFRLDVVISDDTIRTIVRNLSGGELSINQGRGGAAVRPWRSARPTPTGRALAARFTLGEPGDALG